MTVLIISWIVIVSSLLYSINNWKASNYNKFNAFAIIQFSFTSFGDLLAVISMPINDMNWGLANLTLIFSISVICQDAATFINNILLAYRLRVFKQVAKIPNWVEKALYTFIACNYVILGLSSDFLLLMSGNTTIGLLVHVVYYIFYLLNSVIIAVTSVVLILKFNSQAAKYQGTAGQETNNFKKRETRKVIIALSTSAIFLLIVGISEVFLQDIFPLTDSLAGLVLRAIFALHLWYNNVIKRIVLGQQKKKEITVKKEQPSIK